MRVGWIGLLFIPLVILQVAEARHLDEYDVRIRAEARLPAQWFICKSSTDCELVSVPCQSGLAVNTSRAAEAREALIKEYPLCLGQSLNDTKAVCDERQCVTKSTKVHESP